MSEAKNIRRRVHLRPVTLPWSRDDSLLERAAVARRLFCKPLDGRHHRRMTVLSLGLALVDLTINDSTPQIATTNWERAIGMDRFEELKSLAPLRDVLLPASNS